MLGLLVVVVAVVEVVVITVVTVALALFHSSGIHVLPSPGT